MQKFLYDWSYEVNTILASSQSIKISAYLQAFVEWLEVNAGLRTTCQRNTQSLIDDEPLSKSHRNSQLSFAATVGRRPGGTNIKPHAPDEYEEGSDKSRTLRQRGKVQWNKGSQGGDGSRDKMENFSQWREHRFSIRSLLLRRMHDWFPRPRGLKGRIPRAYQSCKRSYDRIHHQLWFDCSENLQKLETDVNKKCLKIKYQLTQTLLASANVSEVGQKTERWGQIWSRSDWISLCSHTWLGCDCHNRAKGGYPTFKDFLKQTNGAGSSHDNSYLRRGAPFPEA